MDILRIQAPIGLLESIYTIADKNARTIGAIIDKSVIDLGEIIWIDILLNDMSDSEIEINVISYFANVVSEITEQLKNKQMNELSFIYIIIIERDINFTGQSNVELTSEDIAILAKNSISFGVQYLIVS